MIGSSFSLYPYTLNLSNELTISYGYASSRGILSCFCRLKGMTVSRSNKLPSNIFPSLRLIGTIYVFLDSMEKCLLIFRILRVLLRLSFILRLPAKLVPIDNDFPCLGATAFNFGSFVPFLYLGIKSGMSSLN